MNNKMSKFQNWKSWDLSFSRSDFEVLYLLNPLPCYEVDSCFTLGLNAGINDIDTPPLSIIDDSLLFQSWKNGYCIGKEGNIVNNTIYKDYLLNNKRHYFQSYKD
jgi:hypothetical protein